MRNLRNFIRYFKKRIIIISLVAVLFLGGLVGLAFATSDDTTDGSEFISQMTEWYGEDWLNVLKEAELHPDDIEEADIKGYYAQCYYSFMSSSNYESYDQNNFKLFLKGELRGGSLSRDYIGISSARKKIKNGETIEYEKAKGLVDRLKKNNLLFWNLANQIDFMAGSDSENAISSALQVGTESWSNSTAIPDVVVNNHSLPAVTIALRTVNDSLKMFALVLACIMFFVGLMSAALQQQAYEEVIFKRLVTLMITIGMVVFSTMLVLNISNVGTGIMNLLNSKLRASGNVDMKTQIENVKLQIYFACESDLGDAWYQEVVDTIASMSNLVSMNIGMLPSYLSSWIATIVVFVICIGRAVEIYIMAAMAPLAVCDISGGQGMGMSHTGRFIKNVCAISLQGAIIVLGMHICETMKLSYLGNFSGEFGDFFVLQWNIVLIAFVQIGLVTKSLKLSKEIIGVA